MNITRFILAALAVVLVSATPLSRSKRNADCRKENVYVGGTWSNDYIFDIKSEEACIEECNKMDNCTAVNYFPLHEACLPQVESTSSDSSLESREEENTVYIIVKGCQAAQRAFWGVGPGKGYLGRRKRDAGCKLENVLVGGEVVNNAYIENVASEEACIEECNKLEQCNAVNYWAEFGDCLPQIQTLANAEEKDSLSSREEPGTNYIVVKGCNGPIEKPANILPPVESGESEQPEETEQPERRKRNADCRKENLFVGGTWSNDYIFDVKSEEACIEECNKLDNCTAVNYFPLHEACLPQVENTVSDSSIESREEENTIYVIVKGCKSTRVGPGRRKRQAACKLENILVGGEVVNSAYIENVASEEACIEECNKLEQCNAVNYWAEFGDCLPQIQTLANAEEKDSLSSREEPGTNYIVVKGCNGPIEKPANILPAVEGESEQPEETEQLERRKRKADCRKENLFVGGTWSNDYIFDIINEEDCVKECNKMDNCTAVNYFPLHEACLPQVENTVSDSSIESREEKNTVYIIVKGCKSTRVGPGRRKRDAGCKLENVLVGGEVVNNAYIKNVTSEEACVEECNKLKQCNAINYFPEPQVCLPQVQTLANAEEKDSLASREEPGTVYVVVKGCNGPIEKPANILPPVKRPTEEPEQPEVSTDQPDFTEEPEPEVSTEQALRRKRDAGCKLQDVLVGGEVVNNAYIQNVTSEEACVEECNKLKQCNAINYFPEREACLPQIQTLANAEDKDRLSSREEPGTVYVVVKGCTGTIEKPANILPPAERPTGEPEPEPTEEPEQPEPTGEPEPEPTGEPEPEPTGEPEPEPTGEPEQPEPTEQPDTESE